MVKPQKTFEKERKHSSKRTQTNRVMWHARAVWHDMSSKWHQKIPILKCVHNELIIVKWKGSSGQTCKFSCCNLASISKNNFELYSFKNYVADPTNATVYYCHIRLFSSSSTHCPTSHLISPRLLLLSRPILSEFKFVPFFCFRWFNISAKNYFLLHNL